MNKKASVFSIGFSIALFVMTILGGIFLFIFLDQSVDEFLITPLDTVSHQIVDDLSLSSQTNDTLNFLRTAYDDRPISYDIYFVVILLIAIVSTSFSAIQAKRIGYFSIFGYIFIFSMFFMLIMFFINQFTDYLIVNFMLPLFNDVNLDIPIILHFFSNLSIYTFLWFLWLGFLGFADFKDVARGVLDKGESLTRGSFRR
jgi:hypothetical protein